MELATLSPTTVDFDFTSGRSSPVINYSTAPSSPTRPRRGFLSAPSSPSRSPEFLHQNFDYFSKDGGRSTRYGPASAVPFDWEETPGTPKSAPGTDTGFDFGFAFDVSVDSEKGSLSAEELFSGGKIRPLKPPPRMEFAGLEEQPSPRSQAMCSPRSPIARGKKIFQDALSPRRKKQSNPNSGDDSDPFAVAASNAGKEEASPDRRGRDQGSYGANWRRRVARSLSPFRVWEFQWEEEDRKQSFKQSSPLSNQKASWGNSDSSDSSSSKWVPKKWSFKRFLLFRSSSEGRAPEEDRLRRTILWLRNRKSDR